MGLSNLFEGVDSIDVKLKLPVEYPIEKRIRSLDQLLVRLYVVDGHWACHKQRPHERQPSQIEQKWRAQSRARMGGCDGI
jgi:hypothetical protein